MLLLLPLRVDEYEDDLSEASIALRSEELTGSVANVNDDLFVKAYQQGYPITSIIDALPSFFQRLDYFQNAWMA